MRLRPALFGAALLPWFGAVAGAGETTYKPVDLSSWTPKTAGSAMALLEPIYRGHPETLEGRPRLRIELEKKAIGGNNLLVAIVEMTGFLDDSVDGTKHRAEIIQGNSGWELKTLGVTYKCRRPPNSGWTHRQCS